MRSTAHRVRIVTLRDSGLQIKISYNWLRLRFHCGRLKIKERSSVNQTDLAERDPSCQENQT